MDTADPQQMNGYNYANNSPITNSDPDGKMCRKTSDGVECFNGDGVDRRPNDHGGYDVYNPSGRRVARSGNSYGNNSGAGGAAGAIVGKTSGSKSPQKPVEKCGFVCGVTKVNEFLYGFGSATMKATSPFGVLLMIPGIEGGIASWGGMDANSSAWKWGGWTFDIASIFAGGGGVARAVGKGGLKALFRKCRSNSFVPGAMVLMAGGAKKAIQNLKVGDEVLATDPETGETRAEPVLATITSKGDKDLVQITVDTDSARSLPMLGDTPGTSSVLLTQVADDSDRSGVIIATDNHPFWVAGDISKWVEAADLEPGMWLRTSAGTYVQVTATEHRTAHHQRVHNLTVANLHTYYVEAGNTPVLVHNSGPCKVPMSSAIGGDPALVKAAQRAGKDQTVQREMDSLFAQLSNGNMNPGIGTKALAGSDVSYARGANGARLFFRNVGGGIQVVGKSDKKNESKVIARLMELYGQ